MTEPVFVRVLNLLSERIEGISIAAGYNTDLGDSAQMVVGLGVADPRTHPAGTIIIEATRELGFDADGAQRQGVSPLEQRPSRDVIVSAAVNLTDRDHWLKTSELIAADLRKAIFRNGPDWQVLGVVRLEQSSQDSGWPEPGSNTLIVQLTFRVTYIER